MSQTRQSSLTFHVYFGGESLNKLVVRANELGVMRGFSVSIDGLVVAYLQFVDDSLFFCEASREDLLG